MKRIALALVFAVCLAVAPATANALYPPAPDVHVVSINDNQFGIATVAPSDDVFVVTDYAHLPNPTVLRMEVWTVPDPCKFPPDEPVLVAWKNTTAFMGGTGSFAWSSFAAPLVYGEYKVIVTADGTTAEGTKNFFVLPPP